MTLPTCPQLKTMDSNPISTWSWICKPYISSWSPSWLISRPISRCGSAKPWLEQILASYVSHAQYATQEKGGGVYVGGGAILETYVVQV